MLASATHHRGPDRQPRMPREAWLRGFSAEQWHDLKHKFFVELNGYTEVPSTMRIGERRVFYYWLDTGQLKPIPPARMSPGPRVQRIAFVEDRSRDGYVEGCAAIAIKRRAAKMLEKQWRMQMEKWR